MVDPQVNAVLRTLSILCTLVDGCVYAAVLHSLPTLVTTGHLSGKNSTFLVIKSWKVKVPFLNLFE